MRVCTILLKIRKVMKCGNGVIFGLFMSMYGDLMCMYVVEYG
jgi:hypothetical protein